MSNNNNKATDPPVRPATRPASLDYQTREVINQALAEEPAASMMLAAAAHTARQNRVQSTSLSPPMKHSIPFLPFFPLHFFLVEISRC